MEAADYRDNEAGLHDLRRVPCGLTRKHCRVMQQPSRTAAPHCNVPLRRRHSFCRQCIIVGHVVSFLLATFPAVIGAAAAGNSHHGELEREQLLPSAIAIVGPLEQERLAAANDGGLRFREAAAEASTMAMLLAAERRQDLKLLAAVSPDSSRRAGAKADIGIEAFQLRSWAAAGGLLGVAGDASGRVAAGTTLRTKLAGELMTVFVLLTVIVMLLAAVYFLTGGTMEQMRHDPMGAIRQDASGIYHDPRAAVNTAEANAGRYYTDAKGRLIRAEERGVQYMHDGRDRAANMYHDGVDRGKQFYADHRSASGSESPRGGPPPAGGAYAQEYGQAAGSSGDGYGETATQYAQQPQGVQPGTKKFFCC